MGLLTHIRLRQQVEAITIDIVIEDLADAMDGDGGGDVEVGLGDGSVVDGEVGLGVVGDEDGLAGEESGEPSVGLEELEVGEGEPLWDDVVGEHERVGVDEVVDGVVLRDEERGAQREDHWVGAGDDVHPAPEVPCPDQSVDYVVQLLRWRGRCRRRRRQRLWRRRRSR